MAILEFHHANGCTDDVARKIVDYLIEHGHRAVNPSAGFPMEMDRFPGKLWVISHKIVAEAAGLGKMGIHRNVIHPKFGNFILLGTVISVLEVEETASELDFNPCFECKLCVAACPTGAISSEGEFNFSACYTHNYREFMGGFTDLLETIVESNDRLGFRRKVSDDESASWWQSLSYGANYKAAYCMAVCPAGEEVITPYRQNRKAFVAEVVRPLQQKQEVVYVTGNADATAIVEKRFKNKRTKQVSNSLRPTSIQGLLQGMPLTFQPGRSKGLNARYHLRFKRDSKTTAEATVIIADKKLHVLDGLEGEPDTTVIAQEDAWLGFVRQERSLWWQLLLRRVVVRGKISLLSRFGDCFAN